MSVIVRSLSNRMMWHSSSASEVLKDAHTFLASPLQEKQHTAIFDPTMQVIKIINWRFSRPILVGYLKIKQWRLV